MCEKVNNKGKIISEKCLMKKKMVLVVKIIMENMKNLKDMKDIGKMIYSMVKDLCNILMVHLMMGNGRMDLDQGMENIF